MYLDHLVMFLRVQSVFGYYWECLVVVECNLVCFVVCCWWQKVGDMSRESGGPLYHVWLWLGMVGCMLVVALGEKYDSL